MRFLVPAGLAALLLPAVPAASAQAPTPHSGPVFGLVGELAVEYGGDRFAEFRYTDGRTQTMRAGQGGTAALGVTVRPGVASRLGARATVGVKFVTTAADNATILLTRIPVELVGTVQITDDVWAGAGYVYHGRIRYSGDGFGPDVAFDPAHGATVEAGWRWLGLTYTKIAYTDAFGFEYDASSVGATAIIPLLRK